MRNFVSSLASAALGLALVTSFGCAGDQGDINRVQPGYIKKSDLLNKRWYYQRTVVDAPETTAQWLGFGMGDHGTNERVRFEIQENYLVAFRDYETVLNGEHREGDPDHYEGSPIAVFPIASHFDIVRGYSDSTGEETNVIGENTTDREWYNRDYMRVNWWRVGLSDSHWALFPLDFYDTDGAEGGANWVDPDKAANPFHARLTPGQGYFDFVVNHFVVPDPYTCYLYLDYSAFEAVDACASGEIKVRHAFVEMNEAEERGYQPLDVPDSVVLADANGEEIVDPATGEVEREPINGRFGVIRLDRYTWDDQRGSTESGTLHRSIRYNIWKKSVDDNGNVIPEAQREVRPIVYYLNWDFPEELKQSAIEDGEEWNQVFKGIVAELQNKSVSQVPDVFMIRENACNKDSLENYLDKHDLRSKVRDVVGVGLSTATLGNWCTATEYLSDGDFRWQQVGDARYHMVYWVTQKVEVGWWGLSGFTGDPVSGRMVTSRVHIMGDVTDERANAILEYIDLINGETTVQQLLAGADVPNYYFAGGYDPAAMTGDTGHGSGRRQSAGLARVPG
jgi:hypothetical protein